MKQNNMQRALLFSGTMTAIIVGVFSLAWMTASAANKFSFTGRGLATVNAVGNKQLTVAFSSINPRATSLTEQPVVVNVSQAKIYKPDAKGVLHRITQGNIAVGDDVSVVGSVRSDDRFVASKVVVRTRTFSVTGKLLKYNWADKQMTVRVATSTYKPTAWNGNNVIISFSTRTNFYHLGKMKAEPKDITASEQNVRIDGLISGTENIEAQSVWETSN